MIHRTIPFAFGETVLTPTGSTIFFVISAPLPSAACSAAKAFSWVI
jgi:hypothetical protein